MTNQIPDKINLFNVYRRGNRLAGLSDEINIPEFPAITETISGPGLLGEVDIPAVGQFGSMEMDIPFRMVTEEWGAVVADGSNVDLTLRASQQAVESIGGITYKGMRVVIRGFLIGFNPGTVKQGAAMGASIKVSLAYIYIERDNKPLVELDKLMGVYKVGGTDMLAASKRLC